MSYFKSFISFFLSWAIIPIGLSIALTLFNPNNLIHSLLAFLILLTTALISILLATLHIKLHEEWLKELGY